jgi:hypothetical protein
MNRKRALASVTVLLLIVGLMPLVADSVAAWPSSPGDRSASPAPLASAVASTISYQGRLTDADGKPLKGKVSMIFQLWNGATGGKKIGKDIVKNGVEVNSGLVSVELDVPQDAFQGQALWLAIQVNGEWISPRYELLPVPYALGLKPGARVTTSTGTAATFYSSSGVGLHGEGYGGGVEGVSWGPSVGGVRGQNDNTDGRGVHGLSAMGANGIGVYGRAVCTGKSGCTIGPGRSRSGGTGVYGFADGTGGVGVYGESAQFFGGFFRSDNDHLDLGLGGAIGRINTDPSDQNSNLYLSSNNDVTIKLDNDGGEEAKLRVQNSGGKNLLTVDEAGRTTTKVLQITGGSDLSEQFEVRGTAVDLQPAPGMVVSIDPQRAGALMISQQAYDSRVAGIISGAGEVKPGLLMGQAEMVGDDPLPVALTGRVYCWADASTGAIEPGDLLTTADQPGHAMKVRDHARAQGAILGKAMSSLESGQGLILVLVALQ